MILDSISMPADNVMDPVPSGRKRAMYMEQNANDTGVISVVSAHGTKSGEGKLDLGNMISIKPMNARKMPSIRCQLNVSSLASSAIGYAMTGTVLTIIASILAGKCGAAKYIVVFGITMPVNPVMI